jgi:hypothetical protein
MPFAALLQLCCRCPHVKASSSSVPLASQKVGTSAAKNVTLVNSGNAALTISQVKVPSPWLVISLDSPLPSLVIEVAALDRIGRESKLVFGRRPFEPAGSL